MENTSKWRNQAFCFRMSIAFILLWFTVSFSLCLVFYFVIENEEIELFIVHLSTWLFIIPAIVSFGVFNTVPLIVDWMTQPLRQKQYCFDSPEIVHKESDGDRDKATTFNDTLSIHKSLLEKVPEEDNEKFMTNNNPYNKDERFA